MVFFYIFWESHIYVLQALPLTPQSWTSWVAGIQPGSLCCIFKYGYSWHEFHSENQNVKIIFYSTLIFVQLGVGDQTNKNKSKCEFGIFVWNYKEEITKRKTKEKFGICIFRSTRSSRTCSGKKIFIQKFQITRTFSASDTCNSILVTRYMLLDTWCLRKRVQCSFCKFLSN